MTRKTLLILIGLAFVITSLQMRSILAFANPSLLQIHQSITNLTALDPFRYRVLVPFTMELLIRLGIFLPLAYWLFYFLANSLSLLFIFSWFLEHVSPRSALFGALLATLSMIWAYSDGTVHPWSNLEVAFVAFTLWSAWRGNQLFVSILVMVLAILNRETALALPLFYFILSKERRWSLLIGEFLALTLIYISLRYFMGSTPRLVTIGQVFKYNTSLTGFFYAVTGLIGFLGGFWIYVLKWPKSSLGRELLTISAIYLIPISIFGLWREIRMLTPLIPVLFIPIIKRFDEPNAWG
jgi:hypothetical protein